MLTKCILSVEVADEATGEIKNQEFDVLDLVAEKLATKSVKKSSGSSSSRSKLIEDDTPKLILEDSKYSLTTGALKVLGVEPGSDDRLCIERQKIGTEEYPIISTPSGFGMAESKGNKITKSGTVRFSGSKHDELAEFGDTFILVPHPNSDKIFILTLDGKVPEGNASLESLKKSSKSKKKVEKEVKEKEVEQPEPEDVSDLEDLLADEDNKDFDTSNFEL